MSVCHGAGGGGGGGGVVVVVVLLCYFLSGALNALEKRPPRIAEAWLGPPLRAAGTAGTKQAPKHAPSRQRQMCSAMHLGLSDLPETDLTQAPNWV
jgi:hypothetical protein